MRTNVKFKNGVILICDEVSVHNYCVFLTKRNVPDSARINLMNECLKNDWKYSERNTALNPNCVELMVKKELIESFFPVLNDYSR